MMKQNVKYKIFPHFFWRVRNFFLTFQHECRETAFLYIFQNLSYKFLSALFITFMAQYVNAQGIVINKTNDNGSVPCIPWRCMGQF